MTVSQVNLARRGLMFVLSSPSGAGKSTIARQLLAKDKQIELSISVTTRERRQSELDAVHYHFIDQPRFTKMAERGELLRRWPARPKVRGGNPTDARRDDGAR